MPDLSLTLLLGFVLATDVVVVPLDALAPDEPPDPGPPVALIVDALAAVVGPADETLLDLTWEMHAVEPGWVDLRVVGTDLALEEATLDGRPVALAPAQDGIRTLTAHLSGQHELRVRGSVATPNRRLDLPLLQAARMGLEVTTTNWDVEVDGGLSRDSGSFDLLSADRIAASWKPRAPPAPRPVVVSSEYAGGVTLDASGLQGRAVLRYQVRHGTVESLGFEIAPEVADLQIEGIGVAGHERRGNVVTVHLSRPVEGKIHLDVSYRTASTDSAGPSSVPIPLPTGADGGWITLLRGDESIVLPEVGTELEQVPSTRLPSWARGLGSGTTLATYRVAGRAPALGYRLMQYQPAEEPPTLVDEARYEVAYSSHGGALLRVLYQVRNDRRQYLHLTPPTGFSLVGVRVAGDVVQPVTDGTGGIHIPLEKSIETLQGLVAFPVEVILWGDLEPWDRRGRRTLITPAVDAPVAYARWEVVMPPDAEARQTEGIPTLVDSWTSRKGGLEYGRAHGEGLEDDDDFETISARRQKVARGSSRSTRDRGRRSGTAGFAPAAAPAPEPESTESDWKEVDEEEEEWARDEMSQYAWNRAYRAYQGNRFEEAQEHLDVSLEFNPDNAAAQALQDNVDLLLGKDQPAEEQVMAHRVREMARSRTSSMVVEQEKKKRKAEESLRAGDLDKAERELRALVDLTERLAQVEQADSIEQKTDLEVFNRQLAEIEQMEGRGKGKSRPLVSITSSPSASETTFSHRTEISFEEVTIEGAIAKPDLSGGDFDAVVDFGIDGYEDEDGVPDISALSSLDGAREFDGRYDLGDAEIPLASGEMAVIVDGRVLAGRRTIVIDEPMAIAGVEDPAKRPPPPPSRMPAIPVEVTAAQLTVRVPHAGQVLRFEQRLLTENAPLTVEVSYRPNHGRNR